MPFGKVANRTLVYMDSESTDMVFPGIYSYRCFERETVFYIGHFQVECQLMKNLFVFHCHYL